MIPGNIGKNEGSFYVQETQGTEDAIWKTASSK